ncbi:hypothetical protein TSMEX_004746 [Taenia solium]|eukprot:TsM_001244900 transcript=TsM_001244900 gene=TsM_001244900
MMLVSRVLPIDNDLVAGVGAFGWVWLVRKKENRQLYAMKILKKRDVVRRRQLAHVQAERDILAEADSDWVVKLFFSFQDSHALYLVMEYIPDRMKGDINPLLGNFRDPGLGNGPRWPNLDCLVTPRTLWSSWREATEVIGVLNSLITGALFFYRTEKVLTI